MPYLLPALAALGVAFIWFHIQTKRSGQSLTEQSSSLTDPKLTAAISQLTAPLDMQGQLQVYTYHIPAINALAAHDGRIFITAGFLEAYAQGKFTAPELASVIAHELGHVALGHSKQRMISFASQNALRTILSLFLSRLIPMIGPMIAQGLITLLTAHLSKKDEYEADAYATALLIASGFGSAPQISLFEKLSKEQLHQGRQKATWLMRHPHPLERIRAIKDNCNSWGK